MAMNRSCLHALLNVVDAVGSWFAQEQLREVLGEQKEKAGFFLKAVLAFKLGL